MSIVTYNGITLPYPLTTRFEQNPLRDDKGDVDWCGTEFSIQVQCIINKAYLSTIDSTLTAAYTNPAQVMNYIRSKLLQPRKELSFTFNGTEMIPARIKGNKGTVDIKNGPKPQFCIINQFTDDTFLATYSIKATYWENYKYSDDYGVTVNQAGNNVMYNRWSETVEIDECNYSTRTRSGKYIIRTDNVDGEVADEMREAMAVVGVPPGFLRKKSTYTASPDGLGIEYSIVDKEVYKAPPTPAFEATGHYTESLTNLQAVRRGNVNLRLKGSKDVSQAALVQSALTVAIQKLRLNGATLSKDGTQFAYLEFGSIRLGMYENTVEVNLTARLPRRIGRLLGLVGLNNYVEQDIEWLVNTPQSPWIEAGEPFFELLPKYKSRGSAGLLIRAASYFDPNLRTLKLGEDSVTFDELNQSVSDDESKTSMDEGLDIGEAGKRSES